MLEKMKNEYVKHNGEDAYEEKRIKLLQILIDAGDEKDDNDESKTAGTDDDNEDEEGEQHIEDHSIDEEKSEESENSPIKLPINIKKEESLSKRGRPVGSKRPAPQTLIKEPLPLKPEMNP
jgi:hypothetical protein